MLIDAQLNGQGPYALILDTGGEIASIDLALARRLGLPLRGEQTSPRGDRFSVFGLKRLLLGGVIAQEDIQVLGVDGGGESGGVIGFSDASLVTGEDSDLDFGRLELRLYPGGRPGPAPGVRIPSELRGGQGGAARPFADVVVGDTALRALWDTGNPGTVQIRDNIARQLGLWTDTRLYAPIRDAHVGGADAALSRIVRADRLRIGDADFSGQLVTLRPGAINGAVVGLSLIQALNLAFDHRAGDLWVRRSGLAPAPLTYGLSGAWVMDAGDAVKVAEVGTGSPAAKAGVRPGDFVEGVADKYEARRLLDGPAGKPVTLRLRRDGAVVTVSFVLAAYL